MRKKMGSIILCVVIVAAALISYIVWNNKTLLIEGHREISRAGMVANDMGFTLKKSATVTVSIQSKVKEGVLLITLQNDEGEILHNFASNISVKEDIKLEAGSYHIRFDSDSFCGKYNVTVRK